MQLHLTSLVKGMATYIPGVLRFACGRSFGSDSARYCYSVWLRHLKRIAACGLPTRFETVAELGPGDSLGMGIAAMLTGANRYFAFDAVAFARSASNLTTFDQLAAMFERRDPLAGTDEFPQISPTVDSLDFPDPPLDAARMAGTLAPLRKSAIRAALAGERSDGIGVRYVAPWTDAAVIDGESVDLAFSQAVLEHVDDVETTYRLLHGRLKPGGIMSHAIDFRSHGVARDWFGHWTIPAWQWKLVRGRRPYMINRLPASQHLDLLRAAGFQIILAERSEAVPVPRAQLAREFEGMPDEDLRTAGMFVIARKPGPATRFDEETTGRKAS